MYDEAEDVLSRYSGENPIVNYYQGFIADRKDDREQAGKFFAAAQELSEESIFPFRLETVNVLNTALTYNANDTKAHYYLGNILYDKQPEKGIEHWESAVKNDPNLAMAYRNLGWGYYRHSKDLDKAIPAYEKAIALDKNIALFYTELDMLYELNNSPIETRLKIFEGSQDVVYDRDDAFVRQITVLTLADKPEKSVEYLEGKQFSYREGTSRVREMIIDAHLTLGMNFLKKKQYDKALEQFMLAQIPDEEAGSARLGNRNIQVNYFIAKAYEELKNNKKAKEYYKLATSEDLAGDTGIMNYYQGLSYMELKDKSKADKVFSNLVAVGDEQINEKSGDEGEFFAIFGEREAESTRKSMAYTLRGLGNKGLGKSMEAKDDLQKAVELSVSNLWAQKELDM
jgi:tetratricopeptide (TPR) repeat protein